MKHTTIPILVAAVLLGAVVPCTAQAMKVERHAYARLCELRARVLGELLDAGPERREAVAVRAARRPSGNPFADVAALLAAARGVDDDDAFRLRAGLMVMALPEVVDPDVLGVLNVTVHAPRIVPDLGPCRFDVRVRPASGGDVLREATIDDEIGVEDLLRFRATTAIDVGELPDGAYRVEVAVRLPDDAGPRPGDVRHTARFWVLRGFKARADALPLVVEPTPERVEHARRIAATIAPSRRDPDSQAILTGAVWQVAISYGAEPRPATSDAVEDLGRAEAILANLRAGRSALDGLSGRMTIGFPVRGAEGPAEQVGTVSVRVPASRDHGPLPLVVVLPGTPTWDRDATRPMSPRSLAPGFALDELSVGGAHAGGALGDGPWFLAVLESPGRYPSAPRALVDAVRFLQRVLPVRADAVFLVGEREGGYAVSRATVLEPGLVCGVALVAGGGLARAELDAAAATAVLAVPALGHPSVVALEAMGRSGRDGVEVLPAATTAWPLALGLAAPEVAALVRRNAGVEPVAPATGEGFGFVVARYADADRTRAFGLAQWLRARGIRGAEVRPGADGGWIVACATTTAAGDADRARLAGLDPPPFDPDALAGLGDAEPVRFEER